MGVFLLVYILKFKQVVGMNDENLIDISTRTPREHKELSRKGAERANEVKKEKKSMRDMFETLLTSDAKDKKDLEKLKKYGKEKSNQMLLAVSMFEMVKEKGAKSVDAFREIMELTGEKNGQNKEENDSFNNLIGAIKHAKKINSKTK